MYVYIHIVPVSLSRDRCQISPSSEVVKWSSDHIISKLSSKDPFESAASDKEEEEEANNRAAMERRIGIGDTLLSILAGRLGKTENGAFAFSVGSLRRRCAFNDWYLENKFVLRERVELEAS